MKLEHLKLFFEIDFLKTIYFNFKLLPFRQAIFLPITLTRRVHITDLSGRIEINCPLRFSLVKFRYFNDDFISKKGQYSLLKIRGKVTFEGKCDFGLGITLNVARGGNVVFGNNTLIGAKVKFICEEFISIGENTRISIESQVFDTNFHYVYDRDRDCYPKRSGVVVLGKNNWIGNRVTIMKDTYTGNNIIVGSNSLLNRDYRQQSVEYSLIGGMPAKLLKKNVSRLFDYQKEYELNEFYGLKL